MRVTTVVSPTVIRRLSQAVGLTKPALPRYEMDYCLMAGMFVVVLLMFANRALDENWMSLACHSVTEAIIIR